MKKDPYQPSVCKIGYLGEGDFKTCHMYKQTKEYAAWKRMLNRCYNLHFLEKYPTYNGCKVAKIWHNFQNFAKWYKDNYVDGFQLDKDILFKNNKLYSPETCYFVPNEINSYFISCKSVRGILPIGITHDKSNKYVVRIRKNNHRYTLGLFDTVYEAFNIYKNEKEKYAKELADKYKDKITEKTYNAIINYKIEITD